jgi:hypothetical protein
MKGFQIKSGSAGASIQRTQRKSPTRMRDTPGSLPGMGKQRVAALLRAVSKNYPCADLTQIQTGQLHPLNQLALFRYELPSDAPTMSNLFDDPAPS